MFKPIKIGKKAPKSKLIFNPRVKALPKKAIFNPKVKALPKKAIFNPRVKAPQSKVFKSPKKYPLNVSHWNKRRPKSRKQMSYPQLRLKTRMNPFGDKDRDRVPNFLDCRPQNIKKQGIRDDKKLLQKRGIFFAGTKTEQRRLVRAVKRIPDVLPKTNNRLIIVSSPTGKYPKSKEFKKVEKKAISEARQKKEYWKDITEDNIPDEILFAGSPKAMKKVEDKFYDVKRTFKGVQKHVKGKESSEASVGRSGQDMPAVIVMKKNKDKDFYGERKSYRDTLRHELYHLREGNPKIEDGFGLIKEELKTWEYEEQKKQEKKLNKAGRPQVFSLDQASRIEKLKETTAKKITTALMDERRGAIASTYMYDGLDSKKVKKAKKKAKKTIFKGDPHTGKTSGFKAAVVGPNSAPTFTSMKEFKKTQKKNKKLSDDPFVIGVKPEDDSHLMSPDEVSRGVKAPATRKAEWDKEWNDKMSPFNWDKHEHEKKRAKKDIERKNKWKGSKYDTPESRKESENYLKELNDKEAYFKAEIQKRKDEKFTNIIDFKEKANKKRNKKFKPTDKKGLQIRHGFSDETVRHIDTETEAIAKAKNKAKKDARVPLGTSIDSMKTTPQGKTVQGKKIEAALSIKKSPEEIDAYNKRMSRRGPSKKEKSKIRPESQWDEMDRKPTGFEKGHAYKTGTETPKTKKGKYKQYPFPWTKQEGLNKVYIDKGKLAVTDSILNKVADESKKRTEKTLFTDMEINTGLAGAKTNIYEAQKAIDVLKRSKKGRYRGEKAGKLPGRKDKKTAEKIAEWQEKKKANEKFVEDWTKNVTITYSSGEGDNVGGIPITSGKTNEGIKGVKTKDGVLQTPKKIKPYKPQGKPHTGASSGYGGGSPPPKIPSITNGGDTPDKPEDKKELNTEFARGRKRAPASTPGVYADRRNKREFELQLQKEKGEGKLSTISALTEKSEIEGKLKKEYNIHKTELDLTRLSIEHDNRIAAIEAKKTGPTKVSSEYIDSKVSKKVKPLVEKEIEMQEPSSRLSRTYGKIRDKILRTDDAPKAVWATVKADVVTGSKPVYEMRDKVIKVEDEQGNLVKSKIVKEKVQVGEEDVTKRLAASSKLELSKAEIKEAQKYGQREIKKSEVDEDGNVREVTYKVPKGKQPKSLRTLKREAGHRRQVRRSISKVAGLLLPVTAAKISSSYSDGQSGAKKGRRVGRPKGPSGKYAIPGVGPVGVYEFRRWKRQQLALERMERGQEPIDQEQYEREINDQQYEEQYEEQQSQRQVPLPPDSSQQQSAPPQSNQYEQENITEEEMSRRKRQEMTSSSRRNVLQTPEEDNVLNAPNVQRGELRGVGQNSALINVDDLNRPITNPDGDYYTEIDPVSGKQVLRRRVREKWLS